jgi:predicted acylesterase/phospholipase RssA
MSAGCTSVPLRLGLTEEQLLAKRQAIDQESEEIVDSIVEHNLVRLKNEYDDYKAGHAAAAPVINILVISGGGDLGAFGAGFLKGWGKVSGEMGRPEFDVVTGVSTGALIAPFAFLGDEESYERIVQLYRNPNKNWARKNMLLKVLFTKGLSFMNIWGLEKEIRDAVNMNMIHQIAEAGANGRALVVNTTNLDTGEMQMWNLVWQANLAMQTGHADPVVQVMLASSAIPVMFPPRIIDGGLYVDGGSTGNVLISGRKTRSDSQTLIARWKAAYPGVPVPKLRYWVIYNNQLRVSPAVIQPYWKAIIGRTVDTSTRSATVRAIQQLFMQAEIARLRHEADVEVRFVAIPENWRRSHWGTFVKETMNDLVDLGEKMGADPESWMDIPP